MSSQPADSEPTPDANDDIVTSAGTTSWSDLYRKEDWWAIWLGAIILAVGFLAVYSSRPADMDDQVTRIETLRSEIQELKQADSPDQDLIEAKREEVTEIETAVTENPTSKWITKLQKWESSPLDAYFKHDKAGEKPPANLVPPVFGVFLVSLVLFGIGVQCMEGKGKQFLIAFPVIFILTNIAYILASQASIKAWGIEYPVWALLVGLLISNILGTPEWLKPGVRTEFYIKTGLVLLGADILLERLLVLGVPGIFVAWVVTPIVLVTTYLIGQKLLKISSPSLNMTISADMSVCGVSAAIATAAACRAKKEELSMAIGLSLAFTAVMMVVMPYVIDATGMSKVLGGAWMGGTIDATGAVAAAGSMLGPEAEQVAITVKMIQNILIGVIAFCVAIFWVLKIDSKSADAPKPTLWEIWYRFPKFVIGFIGASLIFSYLASTLPVGDKMMESIYNGTANTLRGWFFCFAFVSIGLETNFRELAKQIEGGKPLVLYIIGQSFNLALTLFMAWLMFEVIFKDSVDQILG
ncbi:MAG: putative sulfate exporter family transporter [Planctomyces sp.]|nr:putative sulfate exporter family transporter [Planctomyces sp.]